MTKTRSIFHDKEIITKTEYETGRRSPESQYFPGIFLRGGAGRDSEYLFDFLVINVKIE